MQLGAIETSDALLAGAFTLVGVIATVITYRLARRHPALVYATHGNVVVRGAGTPDIEINFRGRNVPRVSRTVVYLWNAGRGVVNATDIVEHDPIRLRFDDEILDATVQAMTRPVNGFTAHVVNGNEVRIEFDFIDANDGLVVEVLHVGRPVLGPPTYKDPFRVLGTIKGMPRGVRKQRATPLDSEWAFLLAITPMTVLFSVLLTTFRWWLLAVTVAYVILLVPAFIRSKRTRPSSAEPSGTFPPNVRRAPRALLRSSADEANTSG